MTGRIASLDGWRAIAITLVLVSHAAFSTGFPPRFTGWWPQVFNGDLGVRIFFVLSAFLITSLLEREHARTGTIDLRAFFVRRTLRIWPLYFSCLAVLAVLQLAGLTTETQANWLMALTFTRSFGPEAVGPTAHFWSLAVEEQFYLAAPALLLLLRAFVARGKAAGWLLVIVAVALLTRFSAFALLADGALAGARSIFRYCDSLALGCLAALGRAPLERALGGRSTTAVVFGGFGLMAALEVSSVLVEAAFIVVPTLEAGLIATMIVASTRPGGGVVDAALNSRMAAWLGLLSYSLYVWHPLFLSGFIGPAFERFLPWDWRCWFVGVLAVAGLSHALIERPFLRIKDTWWLARPRRDAAPRRSPSPSPQRE